MRKEKSEICLTGGTIRKLYSPYEGKLSETHITRHSVLMEIYRSVERGTEGGQRVYSVGITSEGLDELN